MKVAFTGDRDKPASYDTLDALRSKYNITDVLVGDAGGVDADVYFWAKQRGITVQRFVADWTAFGGVAGPMRNQVMVNARPKIVFAFAGGKGTRDMIERTEEANIQVIHVK